MNGFFDSYVLGTLAASSIVSYWHSFYIGSVRKAAGVGYPNSYAPHAEAVADPKKFAHNCAQRAQANYTDNFPIFISSLLVGGLKYPRLSSALGVTWLVGRVVYTIGYTNSKIGSQGEGRYKGVFGVLAQLVMTGLSLYSGVQLVQETL